MTDSVCYWNFRIGWTLHGHCDPKPKSEITCMSIWEFLLTCETHLPRDIKNDLSVIRNNNNNNKNRVFFFCAYKSHLERRWTRTCRLKFPNRFPPDYDISIFVQSSFVVFYCFEIKKKKKMFQKFATKRLAGEIPHVCTYVV